MLIAPRHKKNLLCQFQVCYTFDAGPNACLFMPEASLAAFLGLVKHFFPPIDEGQFVRGEEIKADMPSKVTYVSKECFFTIPLFS